MTLNKWNIVFVFLYLTQMISAQNIAPRFFRRDSVKLQIDTLRNQFTENKFLYEKYELQTLIALSYYPELKNVAISFRRKELKTSMVARPKGIDFIRRKGKRHYIIYINDFPSAKMPLDRASFNAQIGIIGHELAHLVEYESFSTFKLFHTGLAYINKKFRAKFEKATDQRAIDHGLLWQCYDFALFVYTYKNTPAKYLEYKKRFYMSPDEIKKQVKLTKI